MKMRFMLLTLLCAPGIRAMDDGLKWSSDDDDQSQALTAGGGTSKAELAARLQAIASHLKTRETQPAVAEQKAGNLETQLQKAQVKKERKKKKKKHKGGEPVVETAPEKKDAAEGNATGDGDGKKRRRRRKKKKKEAADQ